MLEVFMAGFLGILTGATLISTLFYSAYVKERNIAQESADKLYKLLASETKATKTGSVLSLFKNDKEPPLN